MENSVKKVEDKKILIMLTVLTGILFIANFDAKVDSYNSTILALNYSYGFISRGFIGTIYLFVDSILPVDMISYRGSLCFTFIITGLFFVFLLFFAKRIVEKVNEERKVEVAYILIILFILLVPTFSAERNFGRVDLYMITMSLASVLLILKDKMLWLIIPFSAIGVMVHQGYVFMYFNIVLVVLLFIAMTQKEFKKKYAVVFTVTFIVGSALFLYLELFSHSNGTEIFDEVVARAAALAPGGEYHESLVGHEILGIDPSEDEWMYHLKNFVEFPIFVVLLLPYEIMGAKAIKTIANEGKNKLAYIFTFIGPLTIMPNMIIKCDYGRWVLAIMVYYLVIILTFYARGDEIVINAISKEIAKAKASKWGIILLIYPVLLVPIWDVNINKLTATLGQIVNDTLLHLW